MWKHYITCFYISIVIKYVSCCQCSNSNFTDLNKEKRQLESEEFSATEYIDNTRPTEPKETTLEISTNPFQYQNYETTTESYESIIRIFDIEANRSQILPEENNTVDNIFDINENSSEVMEPMVNIKPKNFDSEFLIENETTTEKINERDTEKVFINDQDSDLKKKCRFYKNGDSFKLEKLAGIWQVVYYRLPNNMKCFKIRIKMVNKSVSS